MSEELSDELGPWKHVTDWFLKLPPGTGVGFAEDFLRAFTLAAEISQRDQESIMVTVEFMRPVATLKDGDQVHLQFVVRPASRERLSKETALVFIGPSPTGKPTEEPLSMRHEESCPFHEARGNCDCSPEILYPGTGRPH